MSHNDLTAEQVRELLDYDPATGVLTWKRRDPSLFEDGRISRERVCAIWNGHFAGKVAGTSQPPSGRIKVQVNNKDYKAHRLIWLIMTGEWPEDEIDHENGNDGDNRWRNLRAATHGQNMHNYGLPRNNTSGLLGVSWHPCGKNNWRAQIKLHGKRHHLGCFATKEEAYAAYLAAKAEYHPFQPIPREMILAQHGA